MNNFLSTIQLLQILIVLISPSRKVFLSTGLFLLFFAKLSRIKTKMLDSKETQRLIVHFEWKINYIRIGLPIRYVDSLRKLKTSIKYFSNQQLHCHLKGWLTPIKVMQISNVFSKFPDLSSSLASLTFWWKIPQKL